MNYGLVLRYIRLAFGVHGGEGRGEGRGQARGVAGTVALHVPKGGLHMTQVRETDKNTKKSPIQ